MLHAILAVRSKAYSMHACGPLAVHIEADEDVKNRCVEILNLFTAPWKDPLRTVQVRLSRGVVDQAVSGTFLTCGRMVVDASGDEISAATTGGFYAHASLSAEGERWEITIPEIDTVPRAIDFEHSLELTLTTGWRREGWIPVHAAAIEKAGNCALLCAPSCGGKSTLVAGLLRNGWRTLGDDKLLLRVVNGVPELAALVHTLNLHPRTKHWFAELGELDSLAPYSAGTEKRRVPIERIAGGASLASGRPTHIFAISRTSEPGGITLIPLPKSEAAGVLLRQIVIPNDPDTARSILQTVMQSASVLNPFRMEIAAGAYSHPDWIHQFEAAF